MPASPGEGIIPSRGSLSNKLLRASLLSAASARALEISSEVALSDSSLDLSDVLLFGSGQSTSPKIMLEVLETLLHKSGSTNFPNSIKNVVMSASFLKWIAKLWCLVLLIFLLEPVRWLGHRTGLPTLDRHLVGCPFPVKQ